MKVKQSAFSAAFTWRAIILGDDGFLIAKATHEMHVAMEGKGEDDEPVPQNEIRYHAGSAFALISGRW